MFPFMEQPLLVQGERKSKTCIFPFISTNLPEKKLYPQAKVPLWTSTSKLRHISRALPLLPSRNQHNMVKTASQCNYTS
eukprot:c30386_g1_i1 orf=119-355(+)